MDQPKMLSETQFNEILTLIPNSRDRANLTIHKVLCDHKIRDLEESKAALQQRVHELNVALASLHDELRRAGDQIASQGETIEALIHSQETLQLRLEELSSLPAQPQSQPSPITPSSDNTPAQQIMSAAEMKAKIVSWLRQGPGAGETVRAKNAAKLASMIEADAYLVSVDFAAY